MPWAGWPLGYFISAQPFGLPLWLSPRPADGPMQGDWGQQDVEMIWFAFAQGIPTSTGLCARTRRQT